MRKRSSQPPRPLTPGHITALSDQFICHPASRSINEIEMAGEIMRDLLKQRDELLSICAELQESAEYWSEYDVPLGIVGRLKAAIASVKGGVV